MLHSSFYFPLSCFHFYCPIGWRQKIILILTVRNLLIGCKRLLVLCLCLRLYVIVCVGDFTVGIVTQWTCRRLWHHLSIPVVFMLISFWAKSNCFQRFKSDIENVPTNFNKFDIYFFQLWIKRVVFGVSKENALPSQRLLQNHK